MCNLSQHTKATSGGCQLLSFRPYVRRRLVLSCLTPPNRRGLSNQCHVAATRWSNREAEGDYTISSKDNIANCSLPSCTRLCVAPNDGGRHRLSAGLSWLWQQLHAALLALARWALIGAACCLASLVPRPAPSMAAAQSCTATVATLEPGVRSSAPATSSHSPLKSTSLSSGSRAAPGSVPRHGQATSTACNGMAIGAMAPLRTTHLADIAAASLSSTPAPVPAAFSTTTSRVRQSSSSSYFTPDSPLPAYATSTPTVHELADASNSSAAGAVGGSSSSSNIAGYSAVGSTASGASSSSSPGGGSAAGAVLPQAADPEDLALAQQLGVGVSEASVVRLFERNRASVVNISGMRAMQTFTTLDLGKMPYGQGSGFIWGDKGHVVTCYHLVKGSSEVKVTLNDNSSYTAKVLGYDAGKNLAVLKLSVPKSKLRELQSVTPGSAAGLRVGQTVYGISNPWGLGHTMSKGLVCGLGLELSAGLFPIKGVILTDAAADAGSSGGALLDSAGSLVGMLVTPPASSGGGGGGAAGRSFAVPIDAVRGLINQILLYGRTVRPALGITMAPAQVLERVGQAGVLVLEVPPGSPAHAAGLRPTHRDIFGDLVLGDVVVGLDGKAVRSSADVYDILDEHRIGDRIKLDVLRDGKQTGLTVTLGERVLGAVEE
ncbi:hypothetical protein Agub_g5478 [Astrephomene gubernaculifera]|uniref:PDZ domain-containing protein n=1 Tax=Astrephomene gubernaculifera TaxID=47775 RepID=A0AAD3DPD5_9CHLO|nr:hypothetical protein Agub_g5478 [Astrephomene gubernaculifera]